MCYAAINIYEVLSGKWVLCCIIFFLFTEKYMCDKVKDGNIGKFMILIKN